MTDKVFVYGTLKRGYGLNSVLDGCEFIQTDITQDLYILRNVGFPYAFPKEVLDLPELFFPVRGEVYEVTDPGVMWELDFVEGEGRHYHRNQTTTEDGHVVWIYEQLDPKAVKYGHLCPVVDGAYQWPA